MGALLDQRNRLIRERDERNDAIKTIEAELQKRGGIAVILFGSKGEQLPGRKVVVMAGNPLVRVAELTTNKDGAAMVDELQAGTYVVYRGDLPANFKSDLMDGAMEGTKFDAVTGRAYVPVVAMTVSAVGLKATPKATPPVPPVSSKPMAVKPDQFGQLESGKSYYVVKGEYAVNVATQIEADNITIDFGEAGITTTVTDTFQVLGDGVILKGGVFNSKKGKPFVLYGKGCQLIGAKLAAGAGGLVMLRGKGQKVTGCSTLGKYRDYFIYADGENHDVSDHYIAGNVDDFGSDNQSGIRVMGGGGIVEGNRLVGLYKSSAMRLHHTYDDNQAYIVRANILSNRAVSGCALMIGKMTGGDGGERFGFIEDPANSGSWRAMKEGEKDSRGWGLKRALAERHKWLTQRFGGAEINNNDITGQIRLGPQLPGDGLIKLRENVQRMPTRAQDAFNVMLDGSAYPKLTLPGDPTVKYGAPDGSITRHKIIVQDKATKFGWVGRLKTDTTVTLQVGDDGPTYRP